MILLNAPLVTWSDTTIFRYCSEIHPLFTNPGTSLSRDKENNEWT